VGKKLDVKNKFFKSNKINSVSQMFRNIFNFYIKYNEKTIFYLSQQDQYRYKYITFDKIIIVLE